MPEADLQHWRKAQSHLYIASNALSDALASIEAVGAFHISENLKPHVEAVERFFELVGDKANGC